MSRAHRWWLMMLIALPVMPVSPVMAVTGFESGDLDGFTSRGSVEVIGPHAPLDAFTRDTISSVGPAQGAFQARLHTRGGVALTEIESSFDLAPGSIAALGSDGGVSASIIARTLSVRRGDRLSLLWAFDYDTDMGNPSTDNDFAFLALPGSLKRLSDVFSGPSVAGGYRAFVTQFTQDEDLTLLLGVVEAAGTEFGGDDDAIASALLIDAVGITPIPEPVTAGLALLGVALLACPRRGAGWLC